MFDTAARMFFGEVQQPLIACYMRQNLIEFSGASLNVLCETQLLYNITVLDLSRNNLGNEGAKVISQLIERRETSLSKLLL